MDSIIVQKPNRSSRLRTVNLCRMDPGLDSRMDHVRTITDD